MKSKAEKWDDGCKADEVRNLFVIPRLISLVNEFRPTRILDVDTGTGYIVRSVDASVSVALDWTLIDIDAERIKFLESVMPKSVKFEASTIDFTKSGVKKPPFDLVLLLFTLLELKLDLGLFSKLNQLVGVNGVVVITMPDSLEDVLKAAVTKQTLLEDFLEGRCVLDKVDKFTKEVYPFIAHRFEYIIQLMLHSKFSLIRMYSDRVGDKETFMLVFRKNGDLR